MPAQIQTPKEYYKDKPMGIRYWILGFLIIIILIQLILPRWTKNIDQQNQTQEAKLNPTVKIFNQVLPLSEQYAVYNNVLAEKNMKTTPAEKKLFKQYTVSDTFKTIQHIFKKQKLPGEFAYLPWVLTQADPFYEQKGAAGIWALKKDNSQNLYTQNGIDERFDIQTSTKLLAKDITELYNICQDRNMVTLTLLSKNKNALRENYLLLANYAGDSEKYLESIKKREISLYEARPIAKDWDFYTTIPVENQKLISFRYWNIYAKYPEYNFEKITIPTTKKTLKGPLNLVQRAKKNNYPYASIKMLNPQIRGTTLPKGKRELTLIQK